MAMNQITITDILGLVAVISATIFSAEVAAVVSPYIVILVASSIGASFALARQERTTRTAAMWFFFRVCGAAVVLTVVAATIIAGMHPSLTERMLLAPVSFVIGLIGPDWPAVPRVLSQYAGNLLDLMNRFRGGR